MRKRTKNSAEIAVMLNIPNFELLPLHQEQHVVVRLHYLLKKTRRQTYAAMKEAYGEQTFAAPFFIGISSSCKGRPLHYRSQRVGDCQQPLPRQCWIPLVLADNDSLLQRQIALIGILQTTMKKIILSLFFPAISVGAYAYSFMQNVRTGVLFALSSWFFHRWCNKLWAICCFFTFLIRRGILDA